MSISLLLFVLVTVTTGGRGQQGTHCQVFPSNYTLTTTDIGNANLFAFIDINNCTTNSPFTTCHHPSVLTDSNTGGEIFSRIQYLEWSESNNISQLLFTFSTVVELEFSRVYYHFNPGRVQAPIDLDFYAVPDDFTLGDNMSNSTLLHENARIVIDRKNEYIPLWSTTTRKLLMNKKGGISTNFAISEVEFYTLNSSGCETPITITSSTTPSEVTGPLKTSHTDTPPSKTTAIGNETSSPSATTTDNDSSSSATTTTPPPTPPSSPVVYIAAGVVVIVILVTVALTLIVIVIVTCRKKQSSVKDSKENVSYSKSHDLKLSPHTGQVESQTRSPQTTSNTTAEIYADPDDGLAVYAVVNKQKKKKKDKNKPAVPEPYQQATPTESHDTTPNDTYAVVDMSKKKRKKKMASHLDEEGAPPPPVPEHTIDQLYAVVQKKPKKKKKKEELPTDEDGDTPPPVPPAIMEDI